VFGIVRNKVMAVLLGPSGVGLMGLYGSIIEVTQSLAGMGIQSSGVRQIAEAVGSNDEIRVARTATALRRISIVLGGIGALALIVFASPISALTFGSDTEAVGVALLSVAVFCRLVSLGQGALIQGTRRVGDLAKMAVISSIAGTVTSIPLVYFLRERGVVLSLIAVAVTMVATSWWYSRKIQIAPVSMPLSKLRHEAKDLLKFGVAFMVSAFLAMGSAYAIRAIVLRMAGFDAAGLYQAAWTLGGLYVGFILQSMGTDFYPRLTGVAKDNRACNRLVNEQCLISLLIAGPGVMATLTLAPLVISLFYSREFQPAVPLLRWVCLGMMLRLVSWPMGVIVVAKGARNTFLAIEVAAAVVHVALAWVLVVRVGVSGAGMAFFGLYLWHSCVVYAIVRKLSGFKWSSFNWRVGTIFLPLTAAVFAAFYLLPFWLATSFGVLASGLSAVYSVRRLLRLVSSDALPGWLSSRVVRWGWSEPISDSTTVT
jgi:PST family polysaccharide transporter